MPRLQSADPVAPPALDGRDRPATQHRTTYYLTLNNLLGAVTGFLFWLLLARHAGVGTSVLGVGYAVVALGTIVGVTAKGGLDTALVQLVPATDRAGGRGLLAFSFAVGTAACLGLTATLAVLSGVAGFLPDLTPAGWALAAIMASLLVVTWLQDAYFVAVGRSRVTFERSVALSAGRLLLPFPVIALALAHPIPVTWALALAASAALGIVRGRGLPLRPGRPVARREFLGLAARNISGGAAEFLPGLLLTPLVLALDGPTAAAYFGIAWTAAQLVFQSSAAIGRSTLAHLVRAGPAQRAAAIRTGLLEHLWVAAPLAIAGMVLAPQFLSVFGPAYAREGAAALAILCASLVFVAPTSLYLAILRARPRSASLMAFPAAMIASLALWAPILGSRYGLTGVAAAWLIANAPFGIYAAWGLRQETRGVKPHAAAAVVHRRADLE